MLLWQRGSPLLAKGETGPDTQDDYPLKTMTT
jgi:hypothetical protein